jgi:hypothetical protein
MKRALVILAAGLLVGLIPVAASGCVPCCGLPPEPVDPSAVASLAAPVMGSDGQSIQIRPRGGNHYYNEVRGGSWIALVDCYEVFEAVFETRMPDTDSLTIDPARARSAAESYVEEAGFVASVDLTRYRESTKEVHQAGVALIDVTFSPPDATLTPFHGATGAQERWHDLEILVNGSSGLVFALVDHANECVSGLRAPVVGRGRAAALAQSAASRPGLVLVSAELQMDLSGGSQRSYWQIGLGSSGSPASGTGTVTVTVQVDANSGEAKVRS